MVMPVKRAIWPAKVVNAGFIIPESTTVTLISKLSLSGKTFSKSISYRINGFEFVCSENSKVSELKEI